MAPKVLESQLVISGRDKTGAMFDAVGGKFDKLAAAGKRMDGVGRNFLNVGSAIDHAGTKLDMLHGKLQRIERLSQVIGRNLGPLIAGGMAGATAYEAAHVTHELAAKTAHAAIAGQHERVRMETAGMTPGEIGEAETAAASVSARLPALSQTTLLHMLRNARSIVGSFEEAQKVVEPMAKMRVVAMGAHPERTEELEADFDQLIKGMEIKGVTQNLPKFTHYMDNMAKALNVFGDTLKPTDYYAMFKYGRGATQALSDRFQLMTAPTFAQEMGGSSAGKALSTFYQTLVGGRMQVKAANELLDLGLIGDKSKVKISKAGIVTSVRPGAVTGWELAAADPYRWVNEIFLPALAKKGITDKTKILGEIATVFRDATAQQLVSVLATQQSRIMKDWGLIEHAHGLEAADIFLGKDVGMGVHAVTEQLTNLMQVAAGPLAQPAASSLKAIADSIAYLNQAAHKHPAVQKATEAGLAATIAGGALIAYESAVGMAGKFGVLSKEFASTLMRAPLKAIRFGLGPEVLPFEIAAEAYSGWLGSIMSDPKRAKEVNARLAETLGPQGWAGMEGGGGWFGKASPAPVEPPAWLASVGAEKQLQAAVEAPQQVEIKGEATLTVKVEIPEGLEAAIEHAGEITGIKVRGSTGNRGVSWPDVGAGNMLP